MELLSWLLFVIGFIILFVGIVLINLGNKRIDRNQEIEKANQTLIEENRQLEFQRAKQFSKLEAIKLAIREQEKSAENYFEILDLVYQTKENEFDAKINSLHKSYEMALLEEKQNFYSAFEAYVDSLDKEYEKAEHLFDVQLKDIKILLQQHQEELNKIKQTYAAAIEAQLREAEVQQTLDFFCIHLTQSEQSTIALIEELKPRLPEPRVLCMLIWSTFYQKKMNSLCSNVLGPKTVCGIYKITNRKTGLCYIGQSLDCAKRWKDHVKCGLGIDTPIQNKLYRAMMEDGITNFTFELLESCNEKDLNEKEKFYIDLYQAYDYGYNSTKGNK